MNSAQFGKAERPARFLRHLVETALRGENHRLKESVIGVEVFGRPASWDPRVDPVVRQEAARLRKRLARYYEAVGERAVIRIELPVGTYVPVFRAEPEAAQPLTGELVPEVAPPSRPAPRRRWLYTAIAACAAALLSGWFLRRDFSGTRANPLANFFSSRESRASIAVLPFANLTADPANEYFSEGLTEEITDSLARFKTLRVTARSSAFQFKGKNVDIKDVGRLLNVSHVLEGSVERSGDRIRIVAHLERVADGSQVWSNTYERRSADLFTLQSELAAGIARSLNATAGNRAVKHVPNEKAHEELLRARYDMEEVTPESLKRAEAEYQQAIDLDPAYAEAYLGLGGTKYNQFAARGWTYQTEAERMTAEQLFRKALALEPDLSAAHAMLATLAMQYDWDWGRAERELQLAIAGPTSATAESFYAFLLIFRGRFAEAHQHLLRMVDLDPFSTGTMNNLAVARNLEGRFAEAREIAQKMAVRYPKMIAAPEMIGLTYIEEGRPAVALPIFRDLEKTFPPAQLGEAMARARAGEREEALRLLRPYEEKYPNSGVPMQWIALVYAFLGDEPNTVKWLGRSADRHEWNVLNIAVLPVYAPMRNSPGFRALEKRMGLE